LIIGGGFSGLAAGVALAEEGRGVRLLEQKPHLGGRARSFLDSATGAVVDNGQHIIMGCYHSTLHFLSTIETLDRIRFQPHLTLSFLDRSGRLTALRCPGLPSPWHVLLGVLRSGSFSFKQKLEVLRLGRSLQRARTLDRGLEKLSVREWLTRLGQSESLQRVVVGVGRGLEIVHIEERRLRWVWSADANLPAAPITCSTLISELGRRHLSYFAEVSNGPSMLLIFASPPNAAGISKKEMELMKGLKKRNIVRTIFFFATFLLSLAVVASAQDERACSAAGVAGEWGYTETGTLFLPTGAVPYASVGSYTLDADGNLSGGADRQCGRQDSEGHDQGDR
jgi:hypothetical protein